MDANDSEVRNTLEESLRDLARMHAETKQRQAQLAGLYERLDRLQQNGKLDELQYQIERLKLETTRTTVTDTLRKIQRQRTLITSWLVDAEK